MQVDAEDVLRNQMEHEMKNKSCTQQGWITMRDGKVQSNYACFPVNTRTCLKMKDPQWNPSVWAVKRCVEINMEKRKDSHNLEKTIVLKLF